MGRKRENCWFIGVYLGQFLGFLTRFFYDNGFGDDGSVADGGTKVRYREKNLVKKNKKLT